MPKNALQNNKIREEKKELILQTALELFAENGFHATSVDQIAKKAGISKGLSYNYFDSKKAILDEILRKGFDSIYSNFDFHRDGVLSEQEFEFFIGQSFRVLRENLRFWKLYFSLMLQPSVSEAFRNNYSETSKNLYLQLCKFIANSGSLDPENDIIMIVSQLKGAYITLISAPDYFPSEKLEKATIEGIYRLINYKNKKYTE